MAEHLLKKLATVRRMGELTGAKMDSAEREVERQLEQVSKVNGGNPITGKGITKSGDED